MIAGHDVDVGRRGLVESLLLALALVGYGLMYIGRRLRQAESVG